MIPPISTSNWSFSIQSLGNAPDSQAALQVGRPDSISPSNPSQDCQTCKNRKYQDRSPDPSVSFQTPTKLDPVTAETAVYSHEQEHIQHETQKAKQDNRDVVSVHVDIRHGICPECGRMYVQEGETTVITRPNSESKASSQFQSGNSLDLRI